MPDLLIELFSEEIPARMQGRASEDLKRLVTDGVVEGGLTYASAAGFATPRRLMLTLEGLSSESPDTREEKRGPKVGAPDKAVDGFCRGAGVAREDLEVRDTGKGEFFFAVIEKTGRPAARIVAEVLEKTIRDFPWPKSMRWGAGTLRWVRPLHSILCILSGEEGAEVVPLEIDGIRAGDATRGHRFLSPEEFSVTSFEDYEAKLKRAKVMLRPEERAEAIWQEAKNLSFAGGLELVEDTGLLDEVAGLVEWPVPLMGEIGEEFLELPPEVLQTSMKEHQKFFSVRDPKSGRITRFVTVANMETEDHGKTILAGNQKVLAARLSDAKFFWENDLRVAKEGMEPWIKALGDMTFQSKLGTQADRVGRVKALAHDIAPAVGAQAAMAEKAAGVAKADLCSEMVYEFPELQGLMGRYYSAEAGFPEEVARACEEHYSPLGPSDAVPERPVSVAVSLADKVDTLTGFWAIDEKPTGSKDPFALRRAALGVIRLLLVNNLRIRLLPLFANAIAALEMLQRSDNDEDASALDTTVLVGNAGPAAQDLLSFFHDRLKVHLRDEGIRHDVIDACVAMPGNDDLTLLVRRAEALSGFLKTDDGENLLQGFKRAANILSQAEEADGVEYSFGADAKYADTPEEKALFAALETAEKRIKPALEKEEFEEAMGAMAALRAPIDAFFEAVQVNAEDPVLRRNRLNLLSMIRTTCKSVADLTKLEG